MSAVVWYFLFSSINEDSDSDENENIHVVFLIIFYYLAYMITLLY